MTTSTATVAQTWQLASSPKIGKKGVALSFLDRLIPEGYEDSFGFHYGKLPPHVVLDAETRDQGIFSERKLQENQ